SQPNFGTILTGLTGTQAQVYMAQIKSFAEAYAAGYSDGIHCSPPNPIPDQHMVIAIGTTNDVQDHVHAALNGEHGKVWGSLVETLNRENIRPSLINFTGAMDIEQASV